MKDIVSVVCQLPNLKRYGPVSEENVSSAEKALGVTFAEEYKTYARTFGAISAVGVELTGAVPIKRLNVVNATKKARSVIPDFPFDCYVIEDLAIDGAVLIQDGEGAVYEVAPGWERRLVFRCLADYLEHEAVNNS